MDVNGQLDNQSNFVYELLSELHGALGTIESFRTAQSVGDLRLPEGRRLFAPRVPLIDDELWQRTLRVHTRLTELFNDVSEWNEAAVGQWERDMGIAID